MNCDHKYTHFHELKFSWLIYNILYFWKFICKCVFPFSGIYLSQSAFSLQLCLHQYKRGFSLFDIHLCLRQHIVCWEGLCATNFFFTQSNAKVSTAVMLLGVVQLFNPLHSVDCCKKCTHIKSNITNELKILEFIEQTLKSMTF